MRVAYLHRISFEESEQRFTEEANKLGIGLDLIKYKELRVVDNKVFWKDQDLAGYDGWYFRAVGTELEWSKILEIYAKKNNIRVVDEYLLNQGPLRRAKSASGMIMEADGVSYPKTAFVERFSDLKKELTKWEYPMIVKMSQGGRHGMSTFWIRKEEDLTELEEKLRAREGAPTSPKATLGARGFLMQEFIPNDGDYRVMTVGYKCIGGFKRAPKEEKMVMNKSIGKSTALEVVPGDVANLAEKASKSLQVEVAGIDLIRDSRSGKVYIVEVNEAPQFKVFEKRTKINAAQKIMEYLFQKFKNSNITPRSPLNLRGEERSSGEIFKVLVLSRFAKEYEPTRLLEEARKIGKADLVKYGKIELSETGVNLGKDRKLSDYSLIVPRSASKKGSSMVSTKVVVLQEAERLGIKVVNGKSFSRFPLLGKMEQGTALTQAGLPTVSYKSFGSSDNWKNLNVEFPAMIKGRFGSHGRTVKKVDSQEELDELVATYKGDSVLIQPVLPIKVWFRCIVCKGEYLGEMRHAQKAKYKNSKNRNLENSKIGEMEMGELKRICLGAARLFDCDYCGIDVGYREDTKSWVIFEVNRTAQFKYFEKRTGVNVAAKILGK